MPWQNLIIDNELTRYEVSDDGLIRNRKTKRVLKGCDGGNGYVVVTLTIGEVVKKQYVHRLVATTFIPNPDNLPQVNHKDENKQNNRVDNLEWCTASYNTNYGDRNRKISNAKRKNFDPPKPKRPNQIGVNNPNAKKVICVETGQVFDTYEEAARWCNGRRFGIYRCCNGKQKQYQGYTWRHI